MEKRTVFRYLFLPCVTLLLIVASGPPLLASPGTGTLYATSTSQLLRVNPETGEGEVVGFISGGASFGFPSLAVDPTTGLMYAGGGAGLPYLHLVDPDTAAATYLGDSGLGFAAISSLDFRKDGTLYAAVNIAGDGGTGGGDHLATIDPVTGAATVIGPFGSCVGVVLPSNGGGSCDIDGIAAIAFDGAGNLWGALNERGASGARGLYRIDINTGAATFYGQVYNGGLPPSGGIGSLQFACDGTLYGGTPRDIGGAGDGGFLITVTPGFNFFEFVGATSATGGGPLGGLAFADPCPPGSGVLYASSVGLLLRVDKTTGEGTPVGTLSGGASFGFPSLAVSPTTGLMYAGGGAGNPYLHLVDPVTGDLTFLGNSGLGFAAISALDFRGDGTLFASVNIAGDGGTGGGDHLATIDPVTGVATVIGPFGSCVGVVLPSNGGGSCDIDGIAAMAFDAAGNLYGALNPRGASGLRGLYRIDVTTGAATFIAPILDAMGNPPSGGVGSLQFDCDGTLYGGTPRDIGGAGDGGRLLVINPATGAFSFVGTVSATGGAPLGGLALSPPCPRCVSQPLGTAGGFDLFIAGDATHTNTDAQGRVAIGGNAVLQNYGIAAALPGFVGDSLVVGGNLTYTNGQVYNGNVAYGGTASLVNVGILHGTVRQDGSVIDFAAEKSQLQTSSAFWASYPANGTTTLQYGQILLSGTDPVLNVFDVPGSAVSSATYFQISAPAGSSVLINIDGMVNRMQYFGFNLIGVSRDHVIFNFFETVDLTLQGIGIQGTVLAPDAAIHFSNGAIDGNLIGCSLDGSGQVHVDRFDGCLPELPPC